MMDEAAFTGLSHRVAHMTYEQAQAGFEQTMEQIAAHLDAIDRSEYCPHCRWHPVRTYRRCAQWRVLWGAWRDMDVLDPAREAAYQAAHQHAQTCPICTTVVRESSQFEECAALSQLHDVLTIYSDRMADLQDIAPLGHTD